MHGSFAMDESTRHALEGPGFEPFFCGVTTIRDGSVTVLGCHIWLGNGRKKARINVMPPTDPHTLLEQIRAYLLEGFASVTIAPQADAKTGSALIHVNQGRARWAV